MAIWQFDFHLVPASSVKRHFETTPVTISVEDYDRINWWDGVNLLEEITNAFSQLLPRSQSWDSETETWGEEDGNRLDVSRGDHDVSEVYGRIDVRELSVSFVNQLAGVARNLELLVVTEDRRVLRPSLKEFLGSIRRSRSFAFVKDPELFLSQFGGSD